MRSGETLFVTFRLAGSIRSAVFRQLQAVHQGELTAAQATESPAYAHRRAQKRFFAKFDAALDRAEVGQTYLEKEKVAEVIAVELMMLEETGVQVLAFALLPNHVHVVLHLPVGSGLSIYKSLQLLHQRTAAQCARKLRLPAGADFWQPGFYEYAVADAEELTRIVAYVRNHAARLRLSERWRDWPYVYVNARWAASADALPEG